MYAIVASRLYKKSLKRLARNKDFKIKKLELIIDQIAHGEILDKKSRDHELAGDMQDFRECHIQLDREALFYGLF